MFTHVTELWRGQFGDEYTKRSPGSVACNVEFFRRALSSVHSDYRRSVLEFGAGAGKNLIALHEIDPDAALCGVEINRSAIEQWPPYIQRAECSILDYKEERSCDLAFTKGLLIHIVPAFLPEAYAVLYRASQRWILIAEYYSPRQEMIPYRGQMNALWKADFAGEMMKQYPDLTLRHYGFSYHRDAYPQDDITWFLLERP